LSDEADDPFRLSGRKVYFGPNQLAQAPVVACSLRTSSSGGGGVTAAGVEAAAGRLRAEFPRLLEEHSGAAAGEEPAVALARLLAAFARGALNDTRGFVEAAGATAGAAGTAVLWAGFHEPKVTVAALALAARALREALRAGASFSAELKGDLAGFQQLCRSRHPDFQARILMVAAKARDIPVLSVAPGSRIWQFGWGFRSRSFFETASDADGFVGARIAKSKALSKTIMQGLGLPTPAGVLVETPEELPAAAEKVGWPCVAKPLDSGGGKGVTAGIRSLADLEQSFAYAKKFSSSPVLVEAFVPGEDHRLTVIDGHLVAATRREASTVTGDGVRTIHALLGDLNSRRSSNLVASGYHYPIAMDAVLVAHLARQDLAPDDVPHAGRRVSLRSNANRSTGGVCFNLEDIHPQVRAMAEELATTLGLYAIGIDYITPDISRPPAAGNGAFIEVNATPDMAVVVAGGMDEAEIGTRLLGSLPGRIPFVLVLAAKTAQHELARQLAATSADTPGLAWLCGDEAGLGAMRLDLTHLAMPERVAALLKHRTANAAVVVWSFDDLQQFGTPVDKADLGLVYRHVELPGPWKRVLEATCGRLIVADTVEEALLTIGR
jgi:D-alanine-D-alanine ligase-like ATP-grasp enzyme